MPALTDIQKVRLFLADPASTIFTDDDIQAFLDMEDGAIRLAAADGCDALAALYAQSSQRLVVLDIAIDTTKRPDQLRLQAKALRDVESESTAFGIAEMVDSGMARDERIYKSWERNGP